jgi:hypothetical protein
MKLLDPLVRAATVADLRSYLLRTGWQVRPFKQPGVIYFEGPQADDGTPLVQMLPANGNYRDFPLRVAEIVSALSSIESRPAEDILRDIVTPTCDLLQFRLDSADTKAGTMAFGFAERFFSSLRNLLVFGACGELRARPAYSRPFKSAVQFANRCRIRPVPMAGFRVDVEVPLAPPAHEAQVQLKAYPTERLFLLSLMRGLALLQQASETGQLGEALNPPFSRISANLCEAILGMTPGTADARWEVKVNWSKTWPMDGSDQPQVVVFEGKAFEQIAAIAGALRTGNEPRRRQWRGRVIRLFAEDTADEESGPLVVTIALESARPPGRVEVTLDPEQYRQACQAHLDGRRVAVKGVLNRIGKKWRLVDIAEFQVLSEATV